MPRPNLAAPSRARRHAPAEQRRAQILAAALGCFSQKGYHAATMDDLVRASGLSKGSLYWHFRSKQDVFLALFEAFEAEMFAAWDAVVADARPALQTLRRFGEIAVASLGGNRMLLHAWTEFLTHPAARERLAASYRRSRERLAAVLRRGVERGEIRDLSVDGMAAALTASVEGLLLQAMVDPDFDLDGHWTTLWEVTRQGIAR